MAFFISGVGQAATRARRTRRSVLDRVPAGFRDSRLPSLLTATTRGRRPPVRRALKPVVDISPSSRRALDVQLQSPLQLSAQDRIAQRRFKTEVRRARSAALRFL